MPWRVSLENLRKERKCSKETYAQCKKRPRAIFERNLSGADCCSICTEMCVCTSICNIDDTVQVCLTVSCTHRPCSDRDVYVCAVYTCTINVC